MHLPTRDLLVTVQNRTQCLILRPCNDYASDRPIGQKLTNVLLAQTAQNLGVSEQKSTNTRPSCRKCSGLVAVVHEGGKKLPQQHRPAQNDPSTRGEFLPKTVSVWLNRAGMPIIGVSVRFNRTE